MCRRMEMRNNTAQLWLPWREGQETGLGRYVKAIAGPTREPGLPSEDVRRHRGL